MNGAKAVVNRITEAYSSKVVGQDELRLCMLVAIIAGD